jgi:hypothetical protein
MGDSGPSRYTFGQLLREIEASDYCYEQNMKQVDRIQQEQGALVAEWYRINAGCQVWRPDHDAMPGIDRIELLCDERCGAGLIPSALRQIRAEVCRVARINIQAADALGLNEVANVLDRSVPREKPKRRGRPKPDQETEQREAQIAADWKRARDNRTNKVDFDKDNRMKVADLNRLLDRVRTRKSRSDKSRASRRK